MLHTSIRAAVFGLGGLLFLGGAAAYGAGGADLGGAEAILFGAGLMIVAVLQRSRYRSEAAERGNVDPGPGGGETGQIDHRFVPTDERFIDPSSGRTMRVFLDSRTGERRYRAEE
jgi:hypothetical protein